MIHEEENDVVRNKGLYKLFTPERNAANKGEKVSTLTKKLALHQLVENQKKIFSKEIISILQKKNDLSGEFWRGVIFVCSLRNCRVTV